MIAHRHEHRTESGSIAPDRPVLRAQADERQGSQGVHIGRYLAPAAKSQVTFRDEVGRLRAPIAIGSVCALALAFPARAATYRDKLAAEAPNVADRGTIPLTVHRGRRLMGPGGPARPGQGPRRTTSSILLAGAAYLIAAQADGRLTQMQGADVISASRVCGADFRHRTRESGRSGSESGNPVPRPSSV
jgi:hypothetical protein